MREFGKEIFKVLGIDDENAKLISRTKYKFKPYCLERYDNIAGGHN
jgi:hypothetical protein